MTKRTTPTRPPAAATRKAAAKPPARKTGAAKRAVPMPRSFAATLRQIHADIDETHRILDQIK